MNIDTTLTVTISTHSALAVVEKALDIARDKNMRATVWIVGPNLEKIAFASMDGATPHSRNSSLKKAQTAASTRKATGWMQGNLAIELPMASDGLLTNVAGGLPIINADGAVCGAIGVAGGSVEQDEAVASEALVALGVSE